jgi:hypothetical protein
MRSILQPLLIGIAIGAIARLAMAHGDPLLFINPFFPLFPSYF